MDDCIERKSVVEYLEKLKAQSKSIKGKIFFNVMIDSINSLQAANVRDDVHGEWKFTVRMADGGVGKCSICGKEIVFNSFRRHTSYHFCPNCGARMDGGDRQ